MSRPKESLRSVIALAYHDLWCGTPPSCGTNARSKYPCSGQMDKASLDAVTRAVRGHQRRAAGAAR